MEKVRWRDDPKAYHKIYYLNNRDKLLARENKRYADNPEPIKKRSAVWYSKNKDRAKRLSLKNWLLREYGLTTEKYNEMVLRQDGKCAICRKVPRKVRLSVDHCHETNRVRGLLCRKCNSGIGMLGDSLEFVLRAVEYLKKGTECTSS